MTELAAHLHRHRTIWDNMDKDKEEKRMQFLEAYLADRTRNVSNPFSGGN